jgi:hypothetical protein
MNQEMQNVAAGNGADPEELPLTLVAASPSAEPSVLLTRVAQAWSIVAAWGRAYDDEQDKECEEWPSNEECYDQLPGWLRSVWPGPDDLLFESWLCDLDERTWIWWRGEAFATFVKIDLSSSSLPCSTSSLQVVIEAAGGDVLYADRWITDSAAASVAAGLRDFE